MKIVQVIPYFTLAGAEIMCENLIMKLKESGHEVIVISMRNNKCVINDRLENSGVKIYYLGKKSGFDISMVSKIKKILLKEQPDVVHTHLNAITYAVPAAIKAKIKVKVHTVHNIATQDGDKITRLICKWFYRRKKVVPVALSSLIKDTIIKEHNLDDKAVPVIYNGIDLTKCKVKNSYETNEKFTFLHVGRFEQQKNHIGLVKAFKIFNDKFKNSRLLLIGDGGEINAVKEYVSQNNLSDCIDFLGLKTNVYDYLFDADAFVLPSIFEGMPITLIEAMGTGLPIIASRVGGVPDMIKDNENGLLTSLDENEIALAMEKVYLDKEFRFKIGNKALIDSEKFSSNIMACNYVKIYGREM